MFLVLVARINASTNSRLPITIDATAAASSPNDAHEERRGIIITAKRAAFVPAAAATRTSLRGSMGAECCGVSAIERRTSERRWAERRAEVLDLTGTV
jgi:hypothetical protein